MRKLMVTMLLVGGSVSPSSAAEPAATLPSFDQAREAGRAKSQFLNEAKKQAAATPAAPVANLDHFRQSIAPVLNQKCVACHGPDSTMANHRRGEKRRRSHVLSKVK